MLMNEVKDIVREYAGRTGLPTTMLDLALENARLDIEKFQNFWWMQTDTDFVTADGVFSYSITTAVTNGLNIPGFKDVRALKFKETTSEDWRDIDVGIETKECLDERYDEDEEGDPECAIIEDTNLLIYPIPDDIYDMRLYYWEYTDNPPNLEEDEITRNFPMALVYSCYKWIHEVYLKDGQGATYWRGLLYGKEGELFKMRRENFKRGWKDKVDFSPRRGPGPRSRRRLDRTQIYR